MLVSPEPNDMDVEIVPYTPGLKSHVVELQRHLWSSDIALNTAYLEWKYEQNPYLAGPLIYLALSDGKAVGMRGMVGTKWEIGDSPRTATWLHADDLVIAPEYRNSGLHTRIMRATFNDLAARGYEYAVNLHGSQITALASLAMGWRSVGSVQPMCLQTGTNQFWERVSAHVKKLPIVWRYAEQVPFLLSAAARRPFSRLDRANHRQKQPDSLVSVQKAPRPQEMAELVARLGSDGRIRHVRDAQYFAWRFRNPLHSYRFLFWGADRLDGYLVLQRSLSDHADQIRVNIVDWEAINDRGRADLLQAAVGWGQFADLRCWTATLPQETIRLLQAQGFTAVSDAGVAAHVTSVLVRPVRDELLGTDWKPAGRRLLDMNNWDLRMIYSMAG